METFWFFRNRFGRAYDSANDSDCLFSLRRKTPILTPTTSLVKTSLKRTKRCGGNTVAVLVSRTILDWAGLVKRTSKINYHVEFWTNCLSLDDHFLSKELINLLYTFKTIDLVASKFPIQNLMQTAKNILLTIPLFSNFFPSRKVSREELSPWNTHLYSDNFLFVTIDPSPKWRSKI